MGPLELLDMSYFEVMSTMDINLSTCLTVVQFWITATFALIIAFHFAGMRLSKSITAVVMGADTLATAYYGFHIRRAGSSEEPAPALPNPDATED